ncbi:hypothetical protein HanPSC8_Chr17g0792421 [Helianthus annuus]|nr:hypothetical protein HanPSC8_Chr17g0792421 [Helianthus annuus]
MVQILYIAYNHPILLVYIVKHPANRNQLGPEEEENWSVEGVKKNEIDGT